MVTVNASTADSGSLQSLGGRERSAMQCARSLVAALCAPEGARMWAVWECSALH
jgi:hypothetical protein